MIIRNQKSDLLLQEQSVFELWENTKAEKKILFQNQHPLKYSAIVYGSELDFFVETVQEGSE